MSIAILIHILIVVIILGLLYFLISWAIASIPIGPPFAQIARVLLILIFVLLLLWQLLPLLNMSGRSL